MLILRIYQNQNNQLVNIEIKDFIKKKNKKVLTKKTKPIAKTARFLSSKKEVSKLKSSIQLPFNINKLKKNKDYKRFFSPKTKYQYSTSYLHKLLSVAKSDQILPRSNSKYLVTGKRAQICRSPEPPTHS
mmetsp:Transcript_32225/g.28552  ORF Transcript_32225/g.28552 Transcript_32225/m.28552 type:complete len:130 (-) Transcript_32225:258-647(-)